MTVFNNLELKDKIRVEYPHLKEILDYHGDLSSETVAAKNIRKDLSNAFSSIRFDVKLYRTTDDSYIEVSWDTSKIMTAELLFVTEKYSELFLNNIQDNIQNLYYYTFQEMYGFVSWITYTPFQLETQYA